MNSVNSNTALIKVLFLQQLSQVRHNRRGLQTVVSNITIDVHKSKRRKLSRLQFVNGEAGVSLKTEKDREKAVVKKERRDVNFEACVANENV